MRKNLDKNDVCDVTPIVTCFFLCVCFIFFAIFVSICISLYVKTPPDYDLTQPIVPGDYIKVVYSEKDYDSLIDLSLTISVDDNYSTVPLELYQSACDDLLNTREQFTQSNISITNCSRKCGIDSFLYFVNSDQSVQSVLTYNFTIEIEGFEAKLMLFDDYYVFDSFLTGSDIDKDSVLQEVNLMMPTDHFVSFDLTKMTRPSYYFVAFQSIHNQTNTSMNLFRQMTQVLWNNSGFSEVCTFCYHSVYHSLKIKQCFILHINTASTDVLPVHVHVGYSTTAILLLILLGGFIVSVGCCVIALLLYILLCCNCYNGCEVMMIARIIKHVTSLIIILNLDQAITSTASYSNGIRSITV